MIQVIHLYYLLLNGINVLKMIILFYFIYNYYSYLLTIKINNKYYCKKHLFGKTNEINALTISNTNLILLICTIYLITSPNRHSII